jgi:hypothetical protein
MQQTRLSHQRIYEGDGDQLMVNHHLDERLVLIPDARPTDPPQRVHRLRILWGQHLVEDVLAGRYRSLVCAVNADDNHRGIISQLAKLLGTSQWDERTITDYAARFVPRERVTVLKYDMDAVEVLALLRPGQRDHFTMDDMADGFRIVSEMVRRKTERLPVASVSFLGGRANRLLDKDGEEPSFEAVLRTMHDAGFAGDVYPAPWMWNCAPTAVYARYPFPSSLDAMRAGGF